MGKKKTVEQWYKDYQGNPFISYNGEFASEEIENARQNEEDHSEWKSLVRYAVNNGYPPMVFCTTELSAAELRLILDMVYEIRDLDCVVLHKPTPVEVWKIAHCGLSYEQLSIGLSSLILGLDLTAHLKNIRNYAPQTLWWVVFAHQCCNANVCNWLNNGTSESAFIEKVQELYRKRGRKQRLNKTLTRLVCREGDGRESFFNNI